MTVYTTTLFADGWTCDCPSRHVDYYEATWPHRRRWSQR